eukprot:CAMPEP_0198151384 /NCGR_PEP_ID=MMETSP1443-20131203/55513_1 /TAXON_ID=186043 /ORGANISM="Entomoneis sp., Strain CCMP2396" /LENGTH=68 /DNA_ID=CAMNT_0043817029 /DNA_START=157 /DNA_END=363 /DNA_ORIENTATION=-
MTTGMMFRMTKPGFMTPMEEIPTPDLAVPYAAPMLAKTKAAVTPIKPKNGAEAGQVSISTLMIVLFGF